MIFRAVVVVGGALVGLSAASCNKAEFTDTTTGGCRDTKCTCEEDPLQPTCKGYNTRPETEGGFDAASVPEEDAGLDPDADAAPDAADAADAADGD